MTTAVFRETHAYEVIASLTGLDGHSLLPYIDPTQQDEIVALVALLRWQGPDM